MTLLVHLFLPIILWQVYVVEYFLPNLVMIKLLEFVLLFLILAEFDTLAAL